MTKNWLFAKITDILLNKIEVSDCISNHYLNKILDVHSLYSFNKIKLVMHQMLSNLIYLLFNLICYIIKIFRTYIYICIYSVHIFFFKFICTLILSILHGQIYLDFHSWNFLMTEYIWTFIPEQFALTNIFGYSFVKEKWHSLQTGAVKYSLNKFKTTNPKGPLKTILLKSL